MVTRKAKPKREPRDINELAFDIVRSFTEEEVPEESQPPKNPAAVALGKLGGAKGGKARAQKLSAKKRKAIAQKAVLARWTKYYSDNAKEKKSE